MAINITSGKVSRAQKVVIYGPEGIGKSTFASRFPEPLFVDTEGSTYHMDVLRVDKPQSWMELLGVVDYIKRTPGLCKTLVLDTADWAEQLCAKHICDKYNKTGIEGFDYGAGYTYLKEEFGRLLNKLEDIVDTGINIVATAHAKMRKFEQPDEIGAYDRWELKLSKQVTPMLKEWADMVVFANYKTYVVATDNKGKKNKAQGGKRVMYTTHHPCWDAKNRHNLKDELPFDYSEIAHCVPATTAAPQPVSKTDQLPPPAAAPTEPAESLSPPKIDCTGVPDSVAALMQQDDIAEAEIRAVFAGKGYFPANTPWDALLQSGFVDGWIIPQWHNIVKEVRKNPNRLPF